MLSLVGRRIFLAEFTPFIISLIVFMGVEAFPGDLATGYLGQLATPESLTTMRKEFSLHAPTHFDCGRKH